MSKEQQNDAAILATLNNQKQLNSAIELAQITTATREQLIDLDDEQKDAENKKREELIRLAEEANSKQQYKAPSTKVESAIHAASSKIKKELTFSEAIASLLKTQIDLQNGSKLVFQQAPQNIANPNIATVNVYEIPKAADNFLAPQEADNPLFQLSFGQAKDFKSSYNDYNDSINDMNDMAPVIYVSSDYYNYDLDENLPPKHYYEDQLSLLNPQELLPQQELFLPQHQQAQVPVIAEEQPSFEAINIPIPAPTPVLVPSEPAPRPASKSLDEVNRLINNMTAVLRHLMNSGADPDVLLIFSNNFINKLSNMTNAELHDLDFRLSQNRCAFHPPFLSLDNKHILSTLVEGKGIKLKDLFKYSEKSAFNNPFNFGTAFTKVC